MYYEYLVQNSQKHTPHLESYVRWSGKGRKNQIDYMNINERYQNLVKMVKTYPGADASSDHILLDGELRFKKLIKHARI